MRRVVLVLFTLGCLGVAGDDVPRLAFVRPPHFIAEGYPQDLALRIPRNDANRLVTLEAVDGGEVVLHSQRDLDGSSAPLVVFPKLLLPNGELLLVAALYGVNAHQLAKVTTPITVLSSRPE